MRQPLLLISLLLAVLLSANVLAQSPVQIQFQTDPVLVQTGTQIVFTVLTVPQVLSMQWQYQGVTVGLWTGGAATLNPGTQFQGRVTITATQLQIGGAQLKDAGNYTVVVTPTATTGLATNSRSIQLSVFDAVAGVSLFVPSVAVEGKNVSLVCTWTAGTDITVQWGKGGAAIIANSRITISGGSLVINPAIRGDTGVYTCTVSNPVSAQTATQSLTVYYGPDTPVLTMETAKNCVGGGNVLVGQSVQLTCMSDSLPPALFSWQYNGQPVASSQPGSGVLSLQTFSTNQSGQYICTATNAITRGTSQQGTNLAIVAVCLNVGEVVGIVIGCLVLILIIVLLIVLIVCLERRRRAQLRQNNTAVLVHKANPNPRPIPPDPQPNGARDMGQGPDPPLYHLNSYTRHPGRLYTAPHESRGNPQTQPPHNSDTHQHNGRTHTNGLLHNASQNGNSYPHNAIDNPAFTQTDAQNANTLPNTQQQNPNIVIQTGAAQGGAQQPAVHVSLNTLPQNAQQNNNAQMPTIHVNLSSFPLTNASQTQQNLEHTGQSHPRMQSGQSYPSDVRPSGHIEADHHSDQSGRIPTGYTHFNSNNTSQQNANTQTYQEEPEPHRRSDRNSWDLLRGTPPYPSGTLQRGQTSSEYTSDTTDYTSYPPIREGRSPNRFNSRPRNQTTSRSRASPRQDAPSVDRQTQSRSADRGRPNTRSVTQLEAENHTQRSGHTQRQSAQRDIRGSFGSQIAPRQEATHSNNPQALTLTIQQASVGRSAVSQGPMRQQGLTAPRGADSRALADPNHLPQAHMAQQHTAVPIQTPPQGLGKQTQPVINGANQPRQGGTAPVPNSSAQHNPSNLTQDALMAHTERAQTFKNRKQQTQAALLHPGPQARVGDQHPPVPPPVIPLTQFKTLPKKHTQHKSPTRGPEPPRPPVNIPVAQRRTQIQQRPAHHHHRPGNGHLHVSAQRHAQARGHGHPAHFTHPQQHQDHRGRPR
ncbi:hypothetical protein PFLUV_G00088340 [Perca fluviatilis]|uniref:Ig-like domain-containing protein n=1 Tax=Perca fluviatilis TaxID=8168 RepID=A0A6A5FA70_PERFL|nr:uncharacterized protein si:dkeyp-97a10.3 [Perca fluviatilis]KAF1388259.1 hypothetical protein PFLUV_G00088340 [Perca fluviatilis]